MKEKRNLKYLIVSACLALLLVSIGGIVVGASENVAATAGLDISGATLDLGDKISIAFAVEKAKVVDGNGDIVANVNTYTTNPTGTASAGTKTTYIEKQMNNKDGVPTDFVIFYSEGFASVNYGETVYARLVNEATGEVGKVVKTSVIELVKGLQTKNEANPTADKYTVRKNLYDAILNYGVKTQAVLTEYPVYNYFTVTGGGYVDNAEQKWATGVVAEGTEITMAPDVDLGLPVGWSDGANNYNTDTVTVSADGTNYSVMYSETAYDTNPWVSQWSNTIQSHYKYESLLKSGVITPTANVTGKATVSYDGNGMVKYDYPFKYYNDNAGLSGNGIIGSGTTMPIMFANLYSGVNSSTMMSFKVNYPNRDLNGNGTPDEAYVVTRTEYTDENGDPVDPPINYYQNGDFFTKSGNNRITRFDIGNSSGYTVTGNTFLYIHTVAVVENGKVIGFNIASSNGTGDTTNEKTYGELFDLTEGATISVEYVADADGYVSAVKIYVNGNLFRTHYASNGQGDDGFNVAATTKYKMAGDSKAAWYGFGILNTGRALATVGISELTSTITNNFGYDKLSANGYGADMESLSTNAILVSNGTQYAWNTLKDLAGVTSFGNYTFGSDATKSSWKYDAVKNSVITTKYHDVKTGEGYTAILIDNPLYDKQEGWNGKSAVFEFTLEMQTDDMNKDGKFDAVRDTINSDMSTVWGQLNIGYGDGVASSTMDYDSTRSTGGISALNALLGNYRITKSVNSATAANNMWTLRYYNGIADSGTDQISARHAGTAATLRIEVTPDQNGVPQKMSFYLNGKYVQTRYSQAVTADSQTSSFTFYDEAAGKGAFANLFDAQYFEISQWLGSARIGTSEFSNIRSWAQTALH